MQAMASLAKSFRIAPRLARAFSAAAEPVSVNPNQIPFTFASPANVFYQNVGVKQVDVPTFSGNLGIMPQHVPTIAVLKPGVVSVFRDDGKTEKYFVSSGSLTVNPDRTVQILAEEAVPIGEIDVAAAKEALNAAQRELSGASGITAAEAHIKVETLEAAIAAVSG